MRALSDEGRRALSDIAMRHGVSLDATEHLFWALIAGQASQAQFSHPDLGGMGQWSQGGMIMVGDMFNNGLKARVDALCNEIANLIRNTGAEMTLPQQSQSQSGYGGQSQAQGNGGVSLFVSGSQSGYNWWPDDLGHAASTGAQNNLRYAFFPQSHRLAIDVGGTITVYDTRDHQIGGFSQQQSGDQSLTFTSQHGLVRVSDLAVVQSGDTHDVAAESPHVDSEPSSESVAQPRRAHTPTQSAPLRQAPPQPVPPPAAAAGSSDSDIFDKIERLAALHAKGILTDEEFGAKKAELLSRL